MKYLDRFSKWTADYFIPVIGFMWFFALAIYATTWWATILWTALAALTLVCLIPRSLLGSERNVTDKRHLSSYPSPDPETRVFRDWDFRLDPDLAEARKDREGYGPKFIAALLPAFGGY
jgi:hypothetical protein